MVYTKDACVPFDLSEHCFHRTSSINGFLQINPVDWKAKSCNVAMVIGIVEKYSKPSSSPIMVLVDKGLADPKCVAWSNPAMSRTGKQG
jgi:hypothetical protein